MRVHLTILSVLCLMLASLTTLMPLDARALDANPTGTAPPLPGLINPSTPPITGGPVTGTSPGSSSGSGSASSGSSAGTSTPVDAKVCTNFKGRQEGIFGGGNANGTPSAEAQAPGFLTEIYTYIQQVVGTASEKLFKAFTSNENYRNAVFAAIVLMVIFYAVGFTIGVVQASFAQVLIRLIKISIIATLISPAGWEFFSDYVVKFFADGTDDIIRGVMGIGTGVPTPAGASPFYQLDNLTKVMITPEFLIAAVGAVASGPFGLAFGGMLAIAFWGFFKLILQALQTYAISYVARALILGLAPVFFVFLLFGQTKTYFSAWVNILVNLSLKPILLFTFLSFFIVLLQSAMRDMLGFELCWGEFGIVEGATNRPTFWRFVDPETGQIIASDMTWKGTAECLAGGAQKCAEFPINILDILTFLILIFLAQRFIEVIDKVSGEISNAFVNIDAGSKLAQFAEGQNTRSSAVTSTNRGGASQPQQGSTQRQPAPRGGGDGGGDGGGSGSSARPPANAGRNTPGAGATAANAAAARREAAIANLNSSQAAELERLEANPNLSETQQERLEELLRFGDRN